MITFQDILTWKSGGLRAFRSVLVKNARDLEQVHDESQRLFTDKFLGACAEAEARTRRALVDDVGDVYKQLERAAHDFLAAAEAVDEVAGKAKDLKRRADADGCNISDEGRVFIPDDRVPEEKVNETLEGELIMREADAILNALGLAYKVVEDLLERAKEASKAILSHGVAKPDPSWNVEEVNDWWTSLSPEEQQRIEVMHPDWVGNLGGVPFAVRDRANRRRIDPMLSDIDKRIAQLKKENYDKAHDPKSKGGTYDPDKHSELRILEEKRRDLLSVKRKFGGAPDGTHSLVSLDAFKGDHLWAAVGSGDIDNADHVAVHTPGMTATVESHLMGKGKGWGSGVSGVDNVLAQGEDILDRKGRNEQVAGITVLNYDAPRWGEIGTPNHSVAGNHQVEVGGKSGADMLYAVQATHSGDPHLVASGHSYGSSATGWALQHSTVADDAMFSGSPGVTTMNNRDLNMLPDHTGLGEAAWDGVADLGRFGGDPSYSKEFTHWSCDDWTAPDGTEYEYSEGHSEYMNKGYTSTYNQASILIGDGVAVKDD
mgnify:CR=1 FL=1